jgi:hypothetical protein
MDQMDIVQQPGGAPEHVKSNENPKQCIRYFRLIGHGCCPAFQQSLSDHDVCNLAVIILAIVLASSIKQPRIK